MRITHTTLGSDVIILIYFLRVEIVQICVIDHIHARKTVDVEFSPNEFSPHGDIVADIL